MSSSGGVGVGFGLSTGGGGGSPSCGAIRSTGWFGRGVCVGVGVATLAGRPDGFWVDVGVRVTGVGLGVGRWANEELRRGLESWPRAGNTKLEPSTQVSANTNASTTINLRSFKLFIALLEKLM